MHCSSKLSWRRSLTLLPLPGWGLCESPRTGYLHKLGGFMKNWKRRYFVLTSTTLLYLGPCQLTRFEHLLFD
jgi:hypothetical protein